MGRTNEYGENMITKEQQLTLRQLAVGIIIGLIACALITLCAGCTTIREVEVVKTRTDTLIQTKVQRDSIYIERHDSVVTNQKGDTVTIERWHYRDRWRDRVKTDTVYRSKTDTLIVEKTVTKTEQPLTWWQRLKNCLFNVIILIILLAILIYVGKEKLWL